MGIADVLLATRAAGETTFSTFFSVAILAPRSSVIASITISQSAKGAKSLVTLSLRTVRSGSSFRRPSLHISFSMSRTCFLAVRRIEGLASRPVTVAPELNRQATMLFPIRPKPTTPTRTALCFGPFADGLFNGRLFAFTISSVSIPDMSSQHPEDCDQAPSISRAYDTTESGALSCDRAKMTVASQTIFARRRALHQRAPACVQWTDTNGRQESNRHPLPAWPV